MKKNIKTILVGLLTVLLIFYGCSNAFDKLLEPSKQNGSGASLRVQINNGSQARLIRPSTDALSYDVSLYKDNDSEPKAIKTVNSSESIIFEDLEIGETYLIKVIGKQEDIPLLEGEKTFKAVSGENDVNISLTFIESVEGTGDLYVEYTLNDDSTNFDKLSIDVQLTPIDGDNPIPFGENECTYISDSQTIIIDKKDILAGTYILSIKLKNSLNGTDFFLMIDPIVEIYPGLLSTPTHSDDIDLNNKNQTNAKFTYYVSNADDTEDNSGFSSDDPITLQEALRRINLRYDITKQYPATIMLMDSITVPFDGDFKALEVKKDVSITSLSGQEPTQEPSYTISFSGECENLFKLGQENGDSITMTLNNITIGNNVEVPAVSNATQGLFSVKNASLFLQEGAILQHNTALDASQTYGDAGAVVLGEGAKLYLEGGAINRCEGKYAGAIYVGEGAKLYYKDLTFTENSATSDDYFGKNNIYIASYSLDDFYLWEDQIFNSYVSPTLGVSLDITFPSQSLAYMNYLFAGKGTKEKPYKISSTEDIYAMSVYVPSTILEKYFEQTKNIVVDDNQTGIYHFQGIPEFSGTYDGAGFAITGLSIEPAASGTDNGFFNILNGARVKNLYLDAMIHPNDPTIDGIYTYGLLAGYAQNSTITNCGTTGSLTVNPEKVPSGQLIVGGLVGWAENTIIEQCFSAAYLIAEHPLYMGGLVGYLNGGSITNAYAAPTNQAYVRTSLSSDFYIGSLVGYLNTESNKPTITNTYATLIHVFTGPSANNAKVGFIGGSYDENYSLDNSYQLFATTVSEPPSGIWVEEIEEGNATDPDFYEGFEFGTIWTIDEGTSFPYFKLQNQKQDQVFFKPGPTPY